MSETFYSRIYLVLSVGCGVVLAYLLWNQDKFDSLIAQPVPPVTATPETEPTKFEGAPQSCIDSTVRFRCQNGRYFSFGSGAIVDEKTDHYVAMTNHHVTGGRGRVCNIDTFDHGHLAKTYRLPVAQSWFQEGKSKDISITKIPKDQLAGKTLSVVPLAPPGWIAENVKAGDQVFTIGCSDGRWPRVRSGNLIMIQNGLLYIEPNSIGGDSGGPVYDKTGTYVIAITAWSTVLNGKKVCLSMTADRIRDIRSGRVSAGDWSLPSGTVPIKTKLPAIDTTLPKGAKRLAKNQYYPQGQPASSKTGYQSKAGRPGSTQPAFCHHPQGGFGDRR